MLCEKKNPSRCNAHTALKSRPARLRDFLAKSNCPKLIPTAELHPKTAAVRLCSVLALQHRFFTLCICILYSVFSGRLVAVNENVFA